MVAAGRVIDDARAWRDGAQVLHPARVQVSVRLAMEEVPREAPALFLGMALAHAVGARAVVRRVGRGHEVALDDRIVLLQQALVPPGGAAPPCPPGRT